MCRARRDKESIARLNSLVLNRLCQPQGPRRHRSELRMRRRRPGRRLVQRRPNELREWMRRPMVHERRHGRHHDNVELRYTATPRGKHRDDDALLGLLRWGVRVFLRPHGLRRRGSGPLSLKRHVRRSAGQYVWRQVLRGGGHFCKPGRGRLDGRGVRQVLESHGYQQHFWIFRSDHHVGTERHELLPRRQPNVRQWAALRHRCARVRCACLLFRAHLSRERARRG